MTKHTTLALALSSILGALAATPALADHNSPMGAGWANMPNDIHNTRIDTRLTDDDEEFMDFVQFGEGADSVNRFLTDTTTTSGQPARTGSASSASSRR